MTEQIVGFEVEHIHGPKQIPHTKNGLIVLCLIRDGLPYLKPFIEHYFTMGAAHIVFLDNDSRDSTVTAASRYDGVTVLRTELPFSTVIEGIKGETLMRRYLIERFGKGRWSLCVDKDELFDYPYSDVVSLDSLLGYLNSKSYTAVIAHMLDMFPESSLLKGTHEEAKDLKGEYRFYDISSIDTVREKKDKLLTTINNLIESDEVAVKLKDGIRTDIFGGTPHTLRKYPLIFSDGTLEHRGAHKVYNARVADFTSVLLHYKFYAFSLQDYWHRAIEHKQEGGSRMQRKYARYMEKLDEYPKLQPKRETSRELSGVNELLENGFLVASEDYVSWANAEEERNLLQAYPQSKPDPWGEAFLQSRRREREKSLRVGRLERQLLECERQEQSKDQRISKLKQQRDNRGWEMQQLKAELLDRDQKLQRLKHKRQRLTKRSDRLTKHNNQLKQRLEDVRDSRAWRLAAAMRHIKLGLRGLLRRNSP